MSQCIVHPHPRPDGYAQISVKNRLVYIHRVYYERYRGAIPEGYQIDHLCKNRACFNVDHLEAVTQAENLRRSPQKKPTECPKGHLYTVENTKYVLRKGKEARVCRICWRIWQKPYKNRRRTK